MSKKLVPSMRFLVFAVAALLVVMSTIDAADEDKKYSDAYDDLDVDVILKDDAERDRYYACFMDTGPCHTAAAHFFKNKAPEAIITACKYCTKKQLEMFEKIVSWYVDNKSQDWNILIEKTIQDAKKKGLKI
ncbi:PREDICTED: ejaculatory bulb-specific protein 3-like [Ceratosolen solmsi marchali]|uniref:Ejaculatory bulb-specific protein 3-like n=1 Tax=Ceratosolen solmsi marchali TaxID=326594 RepID=A0AAJ6YR54_9HYME|nr:PREDICTED: ejaculatory bulb-specific protein 3-like [Ceratosolen solmsi marchali]